MDIEKKLINVKYKTDDKPHLILNQEICKVCEDKVCLTVCPANVYKQTVSGENTNEDTKKDDTIECIEVEYENCLECGACRIACESCSLGWEYPKGTKGVIFKRG